jgi:hypothetical protein
LLPTSKWHLMSKFVYFAFRTIILFRVLCQNKIHREKFSNEIFWSLLFIVFTVAPICHFSFNQFWWIFKSVQILPIFMFHLEKLSQYQIIPKHVNILKFSFLYYKLQLFFKQHILCITFICHKGFMNIKQT